MPESHWFLEKFPIPKTSIVLGSFVYNRQEPRQGYFDPSQKLTDGKKPNTDESDIENPFLNRTSSKSLWAQAMFSKIASGSFEDSWDNINELSAKEAKEYTVLDSDGWLQTACGNDDVKARMEKELWSSRRALYMVTAYRTLSDGTRRRKQNASAKGEVKIQTPISESQGDASGTFNAGGSVGAKKEDTTDVGMRAPGEKIYEIQYRKVLLRGFFSHSVDDAYLETGNRWIKVFTFRDGSGSGEEEDAMEALMSGDMDIPKGYRVAEENGERSFLPVVETVN